MKDFKFYAELKSKLEEKHYEKNIFNNIFDFYLDISECEFNNIVILGNGNLNINCISISEDGHKIILEDNKRKHKIEFSDKINVYVYVFGNPVKNTYFETYYLVETQKNNIALKCNFI